jgi:tetratricopeptide (TPR) repeat protein
MNLKGNRLRMDRKRRFGRTNPAFVALIIIMIGLVWYFDQFVVEELPVAQVPTPTATPVPEALEFEADQLVEDGSFFPAIEMYKQAIIANPADPNLHVKLAHAQNLAGEYEAAVTSAQNALLLNDENPKALAELGQTLTFLGDLFGAEEALLQALELNPDSVEANAYYAELLLDLEDYEEAASYSRRAIELDSTSLVALRSRGIVLYYTGNYQEAALEFETAIEQNNRISDLHIWLGLCYWPLGLYDEAIDEFNEGDRLDPDNPYPDTYISRIYLGLGEYAKAAQFASSAVDNDPDNPQRWANWGVALYKNRQYPEAIEAFRFAIRGGETEDGFVVVGLPLDYDRAEYFYMYGLALAYTRQCDEALPIFQALQANVPGDQIAMDNAEYGIDTCEGYINEPTLAPTIASTVDINAAQPPTEAAPTETPTP